MESELTSDLEYDLAHEAGIAPGGAAPAEQEQESTVHVATETTGYEGGDYGYDMAHDIPRE